MMGEQRAPADADRDSDTTYAVFAEEDRQLSLDRSHDVGSRSRRLHRRREQAISAATRIDGATRMECCFR